MSSTIIENTYPELLANIHNVLMQRPKIGIAPECAEENSGTYFPCVNENMKLNTLETVATERQNSGGGAKRNFQPIHFKLTQ